MDATNTNKINGANNMFKTMPTITACYMNTNAKLNSQMIVRAKREILTHNPKTFEDITIPAGETLLCVEFLPAWEEMDHDNAVIKVTFDSEVYLELWASSFDFAEWTN